MPFEYIGGDVSADLVNTGEWTERGLEQDLLVDWGRVVDWAEGAGIVSSALAARRLKRDALARPDDAAAALAQAHTLRFALHEIFSALGDGQPPPERATAEFNRLLAEALTHLRVGGGTPMQWEWPEADDGRLDSLLWPVAWAAANLLTSPDAERIRMCAGPDCGWAFVDRSRNGLRRWCRMASCGNDEKSRKRSHVRP